MKKKHKRLIIESNGEILFHGNPLDIPILKDKIKEKSIEVFADEDPCIIHKSYVTKLFVDELLHLLEGKEGVSYHSVKEQLDFLSLPEEAIIRFTE